MNNYTISRQNNELKVQPGMNFVASLVPELKREIKSKLEPGTELIFDLQATEMIDSSGIGLLIASYNTLCGLQGKIRVINTQPAIYQLLQTMRLVARLNISAVEN